VINAMRTNLALWPLVLLGLFLPVELRGQESKTAAQPSIEEQLQATKPGPEHEKLSPYAGQWEVEVRMGGGPAAAAYQGTASGRMIVGGRFLQLEYQAKGESDDDTEGQFTIGYDQRHKQFDLIALDSFGTYSVASHGKRDEESGKIRLWGTDDDPMMKALGLTKEFVHVLDLRGADEFAIEVWFVDTRTAARKQFKYMDYIFKRKK
jgi:hypothetical protein